MKKIAFVLAMLALGLSCYAKAWTNFINVGWRIPTNTSIPLKDSDTDFKVQSISGFDFGYAGALSNGFSVRCICDIDYAKSDSVQIDNEDIEGGNVDILMGAGYAPLRSDKLFLGLYGMFGYSVDIYEYEITKTYYKQTKTLTLTSPVLGLNTLFVFTPKKSFSLYSTVGLNWLLPGEAKLEIERKSGGSTTTTDTKEDSKSAFMIVPSVGLCWRF